MFHIIDDNRHLGETIVEMLEAAGCRATAYTDPVEYLNHVRSSDFVEPLATFTDIQMPEVNGYQLIGEVKKKYPRHRFILLSGYDGLVGEMKGHACHFLPKPFQPQQLIEIAQTIIKCSEKGSVSTIHLCSGILRGTYYSSLPNCNSCGNKQI